MSKLQSPVSPDMYPTLAVLLTGAGLAVTARFFVYEVTKTKYSKSFPAEVALGTAASFLLGFGIFFLLLWVGVYV
eukprot:jgi/Botrbrau1/6307/Bobra.0339s0018.1